MGDVNETLDWREAVRKRPAMYIGSTGFSGFTCHLKLIIQNIFHQTNCNHFEIDLTDKLSGKISFYHLHSSIKDSTNENLHLDSFEFPVFNALCKYYQFVLFGKDGEVLLKQNYEKAVLTNGKVENNDFLAENLQIDFTLDDSIWDFEEINTHFLNDNLRELAFLCSDKKFEIKYLVNGEECRIVYAFQNGLLDKLNFEKAKSWGFVNFLNHSKKEFENFSIELAFGITPFWYSNNFIGSYVNFAETNDHGTHVIGLTKGIKRGLKKYVKKNLPEKKVVLRKGSIRKCLIGAIHLVIEKPTFWGPTKGKLQTHEVIKPISKYVAGVFLKELEKDKKFAEEIIQRFCYV